MSCQFYNPEASFSWNWEPSIWNIIIKKEPLYLCLWRGEEHDFDKRQWANTDVLVTLTNLGNVLHSFPLTHPSSYKHCCLLFQGRCIQSLSPIAIVLSKVFLTCLTFTTFIWQHTHTHKFISKFLFPISKMLGNNVQFSSSK